MFHFGTLNFEDKESTDLKVELHNDILIGGTKGFRILSRPLIALKILIKKKKSLLEERRESWRFLYYLKDYNSLLLNFMPLMILSTLFCNFSIRSESDLEMADNSAGVPSTKGRI